VSRAVITLGEVAERLAMLDIACRKCARSGRYQVAKLVEKYGPDASMPELRRSFATDCPRMKESVSTYERCGIYYPHLPEVF
jgi:hypothetical protein